ncbi:MAG: aldo/keto reductase [Candidatus Eremiobacteraeota bacterium]|nr:aldo/keto reductase [Candidatus Eremiobacteraeota bacterium]
MERRSFGSTKREVAAIGQGTWAIDERSRAPAIAALRRGLDLGMTHIDTAEMYGTEELVSEAIEGRRDEVFLVSKVLPEHASRNGTIAACQKSLQRLKTDRLDCYLLHWRGRFPLEDTFSAFRDLMRDGKILSWGVSNFDVSDLEEAWEIAPEFACNQVLYNLTERAIEGTVLPWCEQHGVAVVAYSPFSHGRFPSEHTKAGRVLSQIAAAHGATARQVALRFLLRNPAVFSIPKASNPDHAAENAGGADLRLTQRDIARIDEAFPIHHHRTLSTL